MKLLIGLLFLTLSWAQTITTLQPTDLLSDSRATINTNFSELNTYTMKNHVYNDLLGITTPGAPYSATGYLRVYAKTTGLCYQTSAGVETCMGAGTGEGDVTAVGNCAGGDCFQTATANYGFMGPATGAAAPGAMRAFVLADIPSLTSLYQPLHAKLTTIAGLTCSLNQILKWNGSGTWECAADSGAGSGITDFAPSITTTTTLTIAAGNARIGNYAPTAIGTGSVAFTGGAGNSGNVRVFIDSSNNLVCQIATGLTHAAAAGAMACSDVTTPAYPANSIPLANVTVTNGVPAITTDERAYLTTRGIVAGTGIDVADAGGVATIAIDTATVPQLGAASNDFTGIVGALEIKLLTSSEGTCNAGSAGRIVFVLGAGSTASTLKACGKNASDVYAWTALTTWP